MEKKELSLRWEDNSKGTSEARLLGDRIVLHRQIGYDEREWFLSAWQFGIEGKHLGSSPLAAAKKQAEDVLRKRLKDALNVLGGKNG